MKTKNNNVAKKTNDLRDNLGVEEQLKDLCDDLGAVEGGIRPIPDPDFDDNLLGKLSIVFKPSNLRMKILENAFYIVIKSSIYIYLGDPQEVRVF